MCTGSHIDPSPSAFPIVREHEATTLNKAPYSLLNLDTASPISKSIFKAKYIQYFKQTISTEIVFAANNISEGDRNTNHGAILNSGRANKKMYMEYASGNEVTPPVQCF